jgi:hypothetical protein
VGDISPTSGRYITYKWEIYNIQVGDISPTSGRYITYKWEIYHVQVGDISLTSGRYITYEWETYHIQRCYVMAISVCCPISSPVFVFSQDPRENKHSKGEDAGQHTEIAMA